MNNPRSQPVLVTGATGFIGRCLVNRLLADGARVRAFVLPGESTDGLWETDVEVIHGDVVDPESVRLATAGVQAIFHLAALVGDWGGYESHQRVTVGGTENILAAAADQQTRMLLASSIVVYGDRLGQDICDEDHPFGRPMGIYSRAKQDQERNARTFAASNDLPLTIIRPANVIGPGCGPWVSESLDLIRKGMPALISGGNQNAGLCSVQNVVDIFVRAWNNDAAIGRVYNAADGSDVTWARYMSDLATIGNAPAPRSIPSWLAAILATTGEKLWTWTRRVERPPITWEALNLVGSHHRIPIDRARRELGYIPRPDCYDSTLQAIADSLD